MNKLLTAQAFVAAARAQTTVPTASAKPAATQDKKV
jgi:hypothetical protein